MLKMMLLIRGLPSDDALEQRQGGVAASQIWKHVGKRKRISASNAKSCSNLGGVFLSN